MNLTLTRSSQCDSMFNDLLNHSRLQAEVLDAVETQPVECKMLPQLPVLTGD